MKKVFCIAIAVIIIAAGCSKQNVAEESVSSLPESAFEPVSQQEAESEPEAESAEELSESEGGESESDGYVPLVTVKITIPEGYTLPRVGMMLEERGICTADEFIEAAQNGDFSEFSLIAKQPPDDRRCFKLEGYLYPDTYEIYETDPPDTIIRRIIENSEQKFTQELRDKISASGYNTDEILTIASIIEKEAFGKECMPLISSVLHNRLNNGTRLQCDVTITYVEGAIKPFITGDIDRYNSYYNTYKCAALPAGAICNPGMEAILAALEPQESNYMYFITDSEKNYYFSETWEEHEENVAKML